jgi:hypothetical protein
MQNLNMILGSVLLLMAAASFAAPRQIDTVHCKKSERNPGCELAWDFSAAPRMNYSVERLNSDSGQWQLVQARNAMHLSASKKVPGGYLYRVRGCNGRTGRSAKDCVSSRVVWAPAIVPEEQIPAEVVDRSGQVMLVEKSGTYEEQLEQYNVYLLVRQLGSRSVQLDRLPPMAEVTEEDVWADGHWSAEKAMQRSIFLNYSGMQEYMRSITAPPGAAKQ